MSLRDRELAPLVQARHRRSAETLAQRPPARGVPCINSILLRTILRTLVLLHTCPLELLQKYEVEHHHHFDLAITHSRTRSISKPKPATGLGACRCSMWHPRKKKYIRGSTANSKQTPAPPPPPQTLDFEGTGISQAATSNPFPVILKPPLILKLPAPGISRFRAPHSI